MKSKACWAAPLYVVAAFAQAEDRITPGNVQLKGFAGAASGQDRGTGIDPVFGGGFVVAATKHIGGFADYAYTSVANLRDVACLGSACIPYSAKAQMHELLGGVRVSAPNASRVTPYGQFGVGVAVASGSGTVVGVNVFRDSASRFMFGGGGGMDFHATQRFGLNFDVRLCKIPDGLWFGRATVGAFYRFGGR